MDIFLFNPDTDLALASNKLSYTASLPIRQMAQGLAALPLWYASSDAYVLFPDAEFESQSEFVKKVNKAFGREIKPLSYGQLSGLREACFHPWGWNRSLCHKLLLAGVNESCLPSEKQLEQTRRLSSREQVHHVLKSFENESGCCGMSMNLSDIQSCRDFVDAHPEGVVFKSPWSSSGKGLCWCRDGFTSHLEAWCSKVIREQGLVTVQPYYHRIYDFAMEFRLDGKGSVDFIGYSLFRTNEHGAYLGNVLASDDAIESLLSQGLEAGVLWRVKRKMIEVLANFDYQGYMGVDMMICLDGKSGRRVVHPCVEMNWRMNMGIVSHEFAKYFMHPASEGFLQVENMALSGLKKNDMELEMDEALKSMKNGNINEGKIILSGGKNSPFVAYASIDQGFNCTASLSLP